jgi:hypothetical protein
MLMKESMMECVAMHLRHKLLKCEKNTKAKVWRWCHVKTRLAINLCNKAFGLVSIVANWVILHGYATKKKQKNDIARSMNENYDFIIGMQHKVHLKRVCKWIMDSGATKHITLHRVSFKIYEVICSCNTRLGEINMAKAIKIMSIVVGFEKKCKINKNVNHNCVSRAQVATQHVFGNKIYVKRVRGAILCEQMHSERREQ